MTSTPRTEFARAVLRDIGAQTRAAVHLREVTYGDRVVKFLVGRRLRTRFPRIVVTGDADGSYWVVAGYLERATLRWRMTGEETGVAPEVLGMSVRRMALAAMQGEPADDDAAP